MYIRTKHFGAMFERSWLHWHRPWHKLSFRVGFGEADPSDPNARAGYRLWFGFDLQLLPNFVWWQDDLGVAQAHGIRYRARIVGIRSWPMLRFCGGCS